MRLDDPRLAILAGETRGLSAIVSFVEESGDHRLFIAAALIEDGEHPARPPEALPADLRPLRRATLLRRRRRPPRRAVAARSRDRPGRLRGLLAPRRPGAAGPRRGPPPRQRLVVARTRPRRDERGRARDRHVVANAHADLCPADDVRRRVLQSRRGRRVDLVLGRIRGHRPRRRGRPERAPLRRGPVPSGDLRSPTSGASVSPCRSSATSGRSCRSAS